MAVARVKFGLPPLKALASCAMLITLSVWGVEARKCYWCGPLAEQVHRSRSAPGCAGAALSTDCEPPFEHCAIVATSPPYTESRICVKIFQDECYPLFCNSTKTWRMTCPCRGDLCNGANTDREIEAFSVLRKLVTKTHARIKRKTNVENKGKIVNPYDRDYNDAAGVEQQTTQIETSTISAPDEQTLEKPIENSNKTILIEISNPVREKPESFLVETQTNMIKIEIKKPQLLSDPDDKEKDIRLKDNKTVGVTDIKNGADIETESVIVQMPETICTVQKTQETTHPTTPKPILSTFSEPEQSTIETLSTTIETSAERTATLMNKHQAVALQTSTNESPQNDAPQTNTEESKRTIIPQTDPEMLEKSKPTISIEMPQRNETPETNANELPQKSTTQSNTENNLTKVSPTKQTLKASVATGSVKGPANKNVTATTQSPMKKLKNTAIKVYSNIFAILYSLFILLVK